MVAGARKPNAPKGGVRITFYFDLATVDLLAGLAKLWGCTASEAVRRAVQQTARAEDAMQPVLDRLDRIEARMAAGATGGGSTVATASAPTDAAKATMAALRAWAVDDDD